MQEVPRGEWDGDAVHILFWTCAGRWESHACRGPGPMHLSFLAPCGPFAFIQMRMHRSTQNASALAPYPFCTPAGVHARVVERGLEGP